MTDDQLRRMGARLRTLRRERGLTLRRLAAQLGLSYSIIANWEVGRIAPGPSSITKLANFFGVRVQWLRDGIGPQIPDLSGPTPWPTKQLAERWQVSDIGPPPPDWPAGLQEFVARAVMYGLEPSASHLLKMTTKARELGTNVPLPPELEVAMEVVRDPQRGYRWPGFAEWFLRATDAALDSAEDVFRRKD